MSWPTPTHRRGVSAHKKSSRPNVGMEAVHVAQQVGMLLLGFAVIVYAHLIPAPKEQP